MSVVLVAGYFIAFAAIGSPDTAWARAVSFFPATAPLAMPNRIAMGAAAWWEPPVAVALTLGAVAALVWFGGRVYSRAVLHTGTALKLRDVWAAEASPGPAPANLADAESRAATRTVPRSGDQAHRRWTNVGIITVAVVVGGIVATVMGDVVIGIAAGAAVFAIASRVVRAHPDMKPLHPGRR